MSGRVSGSLRALNRTIDGGTNDVPRRFQANEKSREVSRHFYGGQDWKPCTWGWAPETWRHANMEKKELLISKKTRGGGEGGGFCGSGQRKCGFGPWKVLIMQSRVFTNLWGRETVPLSLGAMTHQKPNFASARRSGGVPSRIDGFWRNGCQLLGRGRKQQ